jgi:hypothetical protein
VKFTQRKNWLNKKKQELERLCQWDVRRNGEKNKNMWQEICRRCLNIERQYGSIMTEEITGILR